MEYKLFKKHLTVPFLPILGVVRIECINEQLINDLLIIGSTEALLPYDKSRRWRSANIEKIIPSLCIANDSYATFVTKNNQDELSLYFYSSLSVLEETDLLNTTPYNESSFKNIYSFSLSKPSLSGTSHITTVYYSEIKPPNKSDGSNTKFYKDINSKQQLTLPDLAIDPANNGFKFLYEKLQRNEINDPVLVTLKGDTITGSMGPLTTHIDNLGTKILLPSYFGVRPDFRQQGYGKELWLAANKWAYEQGAIYTTHQAKTNEPADRFYEKLGLVNMGYVIKRSL